MVNSAEQTPRNNLQMHIRPFAPALLLWYSPAIRGSFDVIAAVVGLISRTRTDLCSSPSSDSRQSPHGRVKSQGPIIAIDNDHFPLHLCSVKAERPEVEREPGIVIYTPNTISLPLARLGAESASLRDFVSAFERFQPASRGLRCVFCSFSGLLNPPSRSCSFSVLRISFAPRIRARGSTTMASAPEQSQNQSASEQPAKSAEVDGKGDGSAEKTVTDAQFRSMMDVVLAIYEFREAE